VHLIVKFQYAKNKNMFFFNKVVINTKKSI